MLFAVGREVAIPAVLFNDESKGWRGRASRGSRRAWKVDGENCGICDNDIEDGRERERESGKTVAFCFTGEKHKRNAFFLFSLIFSLPPSLPHPLI